MADGLLGKDKARLGFPEYGFDDYLEATLKMGMWRRVSVEGYHPRKVKRLLTDADTKAKSYYSHGLYSLEKLAKANS